MSYGPARSVEAHDTDAGSHLTMWFFGMDGTLTATTGLWLSVGGIVLAIAMLSAAGRDYHFQASSWMVLPQAVLGLVGMAAAILGAFALLDRAELYTLPGLPF